MLTTKPTQEMIKEWKRIFEKEHSALKPNRKSGLEVDAYFREQYSYELLDSVVFRDLVASEIMETDFLSEKLPKGKLPDVKCYSRKCTDRN